MKTGCKQSLVTLALVVLVIPHVALAAWWNPFTWKIFISNKAPKTQVQQVPNATTTQNNNAKTSTTTITAATPNKVKAKNEENNAVIESLKKQVADLTQKVNQPSESKVIEQPKVETPKTSIITLLSGAVAEMDANENIIRTIKVVPQSTYIIPNYTPSVPVTSPPQNITQQTFQIVTTKNNQAAKPGGDRYEIVAFQVSTDKDIETSNLYFTVSLFGTGGKVSDISNVMLVDSNGAVVAGLVDAIGDSQGSVSFTDMVTFRKGVGTYSLKGNLANVFSPNQIINVTAEKEKWSVQESKPKTTPLTTFSASDMLVVVANRSNQQNTDGSSTTTMVLQSTTDLSELYVKMTRQDNQANVLTQTASRRSGTNLYDVMFSQLQSGLYDMQFTADASRLIGVVKTFKETYVVQ